MSTLSPRTVVTTEVTHSDSYTEITSDSNTLLIGSITSPNTLIKTFLPVQVYTNETLHAFGLGWPARSSEIEQQAYGLCIITMKDGPRWRVTAIYTPPASSPCAAHAPTPEESTKCRRCAARPAQHRWQDCYHEHYANGAVICIACKGTLERDHQQGEPPCLLCGRHSKLVCARKPQQKGKQSKVGKATPATGFAHSKGDHARTHIGRNTSCNTGEARRRTQQKGTPRIPTEEIQIPTSASDMPLTDHAQVTPHGTHGTHKISSLQNQRRKEGKRNHQQDPKQTTIKWWINDETRRAGPRTTTVS